MSLIHQRHHIMLMSQADYGAEVGANAVIGGIIDEHRRSVGVLDDSLLDLRELHTQRDADMRIDVGVDIDGLGSAEDEGIDNAPVDISGQDDLIPCLAGSEDHTLHGRSRTSHHKIGVGGAEGIGGQCLGVHNDRDGVAEVI